MGSQTSESVILSELQQSSVAQTAGETVLINRMEVKHIPEVCKLEKICFATPWTESMFIDELEKNPLSRYFVLLDKAMPSKVVAYAGYWKIFDEGHITNVAVRPEWRKKQLGFYLMQQMMTYAEAEQIHAMTLEVRRSNEAARGLYEKLGFVVEGVRKKYYEDNKEDALIMWCRQQHTEGITEHERDNYLSD